MVLFSTQSVREFKNIHNLSGISTNPCSACNSIGNKMVLLSKDEESNIMFVSSDKSFKEVKDLLNIGAVRSLSSEVLSNILI